MDMVGEAYSDNVVEVPPVEAGRGVANVVEDDDDWHLGDVPLSNDADMCVSLCIDFAAI